MSISQVHLQAAVSCSKTEAGCQLCTADLFFSFSGLIEVVDRISAGLVVAAILVPEDY